MSENEALATMARRVADILDRYVDEDYVYDRGAGHERKVTSFDQEGAAGQIGGLLAEMVGALEAARDALYPEYADVKVGDGPEYATCPACDGKGWSPHRVEHAEDCAVILCEKAIDRAKGISEG